MLPITTLKRVVQQILVKCMYINALLFINTPGESSENTAFVCFILTYTSG